LRFGTWCSLPKFPTAPGRLILRSERSNGELNH
jgi:hypothetical protein